MIMDNWIPKEGDWVVWEGKLLHVYSYFPPSEKIQLQSHDNYLDDGFRSWTEDLKDVRPATLDDFAVSIPNFGKVWFVESKYITTIIDENDWGYTIFNGQSNFDKWQLKALVTQYNITAIPEILWQKLRNK